MKKIKKRFKKKRILLQPAADTLSVALELRDKVGQKNKVEGEDKDKVEVENQDKVEGSEVSPPLRGGDEGEGVKSFKNHPHPNPPPSMGREVLKSTVSLCMIVRNEDLNIESCLMNIKPVVDEMIVVDTGSADKTKEIAKACGARVYDFEWINDFSAARNFSLSKASCNWILILDADEVISPSDHAALRESVSNPKSKAGAYKMLTRNYVDEIYAEWNANDGSYGTAEKGIGWIPSEKIRLFINDRRIRFEGPVHELVEPSLIKSGIAVRESHIPVHHYGLLDPAKKKYKARYYDLLAQKRFGGKDTDLMSLYQVAVSARGLGRYEEALEYWKQFIAIKPDSPTAFSEIATVYALMGRYEDAFPALKRALQLNPHSRDIIVMYSECEIIVGSVESAIVRLENLLKKAPAFLTAIVTLVAAYFCAGDKRKGAEYLKKMKDMNINYNCAGYFCDFAKTLMSAGRIIHAASLLEAAVESNNIAGETFILLNECKRTAGT